MEKAGKVNVIFATGSLTVEYQKRSYRLSLTNLPAWTAASETSSGRYQATLPLVECRLAAIQLALSSIWLDTQGHAPAGNDRMKVHLDEKATADPAEDRTRHRTYD
jgi:hypothetical protein